MSNADRSLGMWGRLRWAGLAALVAALGFCLMPGVANGKKKKNADTVKVMTQNLYLGSDLTRLLVAGNEGVGVPGPAGQAERLKAPDHLANQVGVVLNNVQTNDFNIRAQTLAKEIKKNKADLVALQEDELYRLGIPSDGGGPPNGGPANTTLIDYRDVLLNALNKKALTKKQCKKKGLKGDKCYRGYYLSSVAGTGQEADAELPGDFDNNPGPNGIPGEGPAFNADTGFPPCASGVPEETNPGGDDTGEELGDPGPPNPFGIEKDPVTGEPTPWDWNGDSSSNTAHGGTRNCGPDTLSGNFDTSPPPSGGFQYASDCPDNNPIGGENPSAAQGLDLLAQISDKSDVTSSCIFHGIDGDARLSDRDTIIARRGAGVKTSNPSSGHFASQLTFSVLNGASSLEFTRGWTAVDVNVRGKKFHMVNTHLEAEGAAVKDAQAAELVAPGGPATQPNTVLLGDLNSDPSFPDPENNGAGGTAYNRIVAGGFASLSGPGNTFGHGEILNNPADNSIVKRIDHILTNSPSITMRSSKVLNTFANGLWGSDHAGVLSVLNVPGGKKKK